MVRFPSKYAAVALMAANCTESISMLDATRAHPAEAGSAPPESTRTPLLVDRREAARLLSLSPRTIFTLTKSGQLPSKRIGRNVRYSVDELVAWLSKTANAT